MMEDFFAVVVASLIGVVCYFVAYNMVIDVHNVLYPAMSALQDSLAY